MNPRLSYLRLFAVALLLVLAPLSVVLYRLAYGADVPDPLPTHWGPRGEVDGTASLFDFTVVFALFTTVFAAGGLACLALLRRVVPAVVGVVSGAWTAWVMATTYAAVLSGSAGAATVEEVDLSPVTLVFAILLVPTLVAAVTWLLVPFSPRRQGPVATPPSSVQLRPDERVTWVGQSSSPWLLLAGVVLVVAAVATVFVLWPVAVVLGVAAFVVAWVHRIMVRVDNAAVTVAWGPARWPRVTVPLGEVTAAHPALIEPLAWGGWGYRVTPRGHAAVVRRGPGLVLSRREGSPFAVTVDSPEVAADLVNAMVASSPTRG
ncbi:MAG: hypothetical protein ACI379_03480 [Nocardioides sp.]|uniref:hypothetical protein n=1 Tax=Nocardioides sp. TaxID=35761 RepID=UPI003F00CDD8